MASGRFRAMGAIAQPFNPTMAWLAPAPLTKDTCDLTFDPEVSTRAYPWLSGSPIERDGALARH